MNKTFSRIVLGIFVSILLLGIIFYFFIFINPVRIHEPNRLKWIPILSTILVFYVSGQINKDTSSKWLPFLLVPIILFKPFNFLYYPFVIIVLATSSLMLLITRAHQKKIYKNVSWISVSLIFVFHLFSQPMIIEKQGFGYDAKGNILSDYVVWDFSTNEDLKLPSHTLEDQNKKDHNLLELKDKTYFLTFWATWCEPCMAQKPELEKLKKQLGELSNIEFVDISFDVDYEKWMEYIELEDPNGLQLISKDNQETSRELGFSGIPMHFVVDKNGAYKAIRPFEIAKEIVLSRE